MPSPDRAAVTREAAATCGGCGLACDDITAVLCGVGDLRRLVRTCPLGDAWFAERVGPVPPPARIDGREAQLGRALDEAATVLAAARAPLVYGLGQATCEAQRAAVAIAEALGAVIDPASSQLDGASGLAYQEVGGSTATLGDVRDRAEVVVIWRADPAITHPRLFERLRLPAGGRALVVVDEQPTETAAHADEFLELRADDDVTALWTLRALVREAQIAAGAQLERPLSELAARLRGCANGAILHRLDGHVEALALHALVRDLAKITHIVAVALRRECNAAGADQVLAWQTGYPAAVSFAGGYPRSSPGELSAAAVLARGDADAALVVASDPLEHLPAAAAERLRTIPVVSIDARATATADAARVAFTTAAPGVHQPGVVHRLDGVPVPLRAPLASSRPTQDGVLAALAGRLVAAEKAPA